jgi:hypothetical protein
MSPTDQTALRSIQVEVLARLGDQDKAIADLRTEVQPAIEFYRTAKRFGEAMVTGARFAKWAVGIGAGIATMFGVLRALAIL